MFGNAKILLIFNLNGISDEYEALCIRGPESPDKPILPIKGDEKFTFSFYSLVCEFLLNLCK